MVRRPGDPTPEPAGGRAAERLRMFEAARRPADVAKDPAKKKARTGPKGKAPLTGGGPPDAKQDRRKD